MKKKMTPFGVFSIAILSVLTVLFVFPFYWIITGSFKSQSDAVKQPPQWWPENPTLGNYEKLLIQNPEQVIAKSVILDRISEDTMDCTETSLKTHMSHLRSNRPYCQHMWVGLDKTCR